MVVKCSHFGVFRNIDSLVVKYITYTEKFMAHMDQVANGNKGVTHVTTTQVKKDSTVLH